MNVQQTQGENICSIEKVKGWWFDGLLTLIEAKQ